MNTENSAEIDRKVEGVNSYVRQIFPNAVVMERFSERIQYKIPKSNVISLSRTFTLLEEGNVCVD